jgi:hypothetical protein
MVTPTWDTRRPIDSRSPIGGSVLRELLGSPLCNTFGSSIPEIRMARIVASRVATARLTGRPHCTAWRCELIQLASSGVHIALVEKLTHHLQQDSSVMTNIPLSSCRFTSHLSSSRTQADLKVTRLLSNTAPLTPSLLTQS